MTTNKPYKVTFNRIEFHRLGDLQCRIMRVLWDCEDPTGMTVKEVQAKLNKGKGTPKLAYTTFLTVCRNLVKHHYVTQTPAGRAHKFASAVSEQWYQAWACHDFVDTVFNGDVVAATSAICEAYNERG